ncbi:hypothetical protein O6H91_15G079500 [Diphasiastrum complanatum]|uniref:Uncharacterized protein n=1 Tax=Diphasiastrum complanatum TaxID=34168 RepID=A0ACC2BK71_DIPCM|nr:hypothetical protein O6H91_15G079500 [Diphasiastrum complanatum]
MGPKNVPLILSDAPTKDMSLMDRMCLKLEAICLEADKNPSLLLQEATKYVENHMSTVGSNMKKLCSEIIRDLLPPTAVNAADSPEADRRNKAVKPVEKEFQQQKESQQGAAPQQKPVFCEGSADGLNEGLNKAQPSDLEARQPIKVVESGKEIQMTVEKETVRLGLFVRCKAEDLSDASKEFDGNASPLSEDTSSQFNQGHLPCLPKIIEDPEQHAYWYVGSEYREALMQRISETSSSLRNVEHNKRGRGFDDSDSDWELL